MRNVLIIALIASMVSYANAAIVSYSDNVVSTRTNWSETVTLPQYNPAAFGNQILTAVEIKLESDVDGSISFENLSSSPSTVFAALAANVAMNNTWASLLANPSVSITESIAADDGLIDYDGPSGKTFNHLLGSDSITITLTAPAALAAFTGTGDIDFDVDAIGASNASGPGNLALLFFTNANAIATVTYIPEPMAISLLGLGGLALLKRKS